MPGSSTTPGRPSARVGALGRVAFRYTDSVSTRNQFSIAAQWLACTFPCRRFADILAGACARLGADGVRYSFIVVDLHHLLLAGLPAHLWENYHIEKMYKMQFLETESATTLSASSVSEATQSHRAGMVLQRTGPTRRTTIELRPGVAITPQRSSAEIRKLHRRVRPRF